MNRLAMLTCAAVVLWGFGAAVLAEDAAPPATGQPAAEQPAGKTASAQADYAAVADQASHATSAADGVALWQKYLADYPGGALTEQAQKELATWRERVAKNQARFGEGWISREELDKKNTRADELVGQAEAIGDPDKANKLFNDAMIVQPHRADIPFRKFVLLHKAGREKEACQALGQVVVEDPQNVAGLNNLGILLARQKQWAQAFERLFKACVRADKDVVWDNVDQAMAMADEAGVPMLGPNAQLRLAVTQMRKAGKHVGEMRWGNSWISDADYAAKQKEMQEITRKMDQDRARMAMLDRQYAALQADKDRLQNQLQNAINSNNQPRVGGGGGGSTVVGGGGRVDRPAGGNTGGYINTQPIQDAINQKNTQMANAKTSFDAIKAEVEGLKKKVDEAIKHAGKLVLLKLDGSEMEGVQPTLLAAEEKKDTPLPKSLGKTGKEDKGNKGGGLFN